MHDLLEIVEPASGCTIAVAVSRHYFALPVTLRHAPLKHKDLRGGVV